MSQQSNTLMGAFQKESSNASSANKRAKALDVPEKNPSLLQSICHTAYLRAKSRGFEPGHEFEDWLAAEQQVRGLR